MYELKKNGKVFTSKYVVTGPSSYEKSIYRTVVSHTALKGVDKIVLLIDFLYSSLYTGGAD